MEIWLKCLTYGLKQLLKRGKRCEKILLLGGFVIIISLTLTGCITSRKKEKAVTKEGITSEVTEKQELIRFVSYYNTVKPHKGINNLTPMEKLINYFYPKEL